LVPANCSGFEQFVFFDDGNNGSIFIQYWLNQYGKTCPTGQNWNQIPLYGSIYCWKNAAQGLPVAHQPITNLHNLRLLGSATATQDSASIGTGTGTPVAIMGDNAVAASSGWNRAGFNVYGAGGNSAGGGQAGFNSGASMRPRLQVLSGQTTPPACISQPFTGE